MKKLMGLMLCALVLAVTSACGAGTPAAVTTPESAAAPAPAAATPAVLTLMTHDSFAVSEPIKTAFEKENNVTLKIIKAGDAGAALNQAILSKDTPMADVFYGVDNTFLSRALEAGIFETYSSPGLSAISDTLKLDPSLSALPVDYGDVCLNYDIAWFKSHQLQPPAGLDDLLKPEYKSLLVMENPATSSPGLAFLLASIGHFGPDKVWDFWRSLRENDAMIVDGWEQAYNEQFTRYDGKRPLVVSYASSPPVEVLYAKEKLTEAPTASVIGSGACFRQIEFVGILKGSKQPELARKLVDFMLGRQFQEDMPLQMFVFPANKSAALPELFMKYAQQSAEPVLLDPKTIAASRESWIQKWTEVMLH
jgi:thiamine transport system substrate-binding protein